MSDIRSMAIAITLLLGAAFLSRFAFFQPPAGPEEPLWPEGYFEHILPPDPVSASTTASLIMKTGLFSKDNSSDDPASIFDTTESPDINDIARRNFEILAIADLDSKKRAFIMFDNGKILSIEEGDVLDDGGIVSSLSMKSISLKYMDQDYERALFGSN